MSDVPPVDCLDLSDFQRVINKLRDLEDKVSLRLNCELPTYSFPKNAKEICERFQKELAEIRRQRLNVMYNCLRENQQFVNLRKDKEEGQPLLTTIMGNLRFIRNEETVDEIIRAQTDQTANERCKKAELNP
ncbi:unnamed protein product [Bursaphelenchus xylophilus]|uniref:Protein MIX23 n=1 Tax=Bursaphelenchus xylophilus TaxID=6326 RepID=A0A1I7RY92_BURXY|nr:unnamed protein product [Bursaphelenchus xylophilus]CAG9085472.1 unnamed protein product [Bursaphelenchus xylophilus]